ncbi:hypothetical protein [Herminiimonas sp. CN]|uniref:hypothetical protein n=1 Tax=Herminiimonas sp. CN TaxID=1349818 RepID=UPI0004743E4E|nr:hypothetical protein [Herminiimonas sp. CN]
MKEHPILFSAPMVRALLDGSKTQTRRIYKNRKHPDAGCEMAACELTREPQHVINRTCPYCQPGDQLWVRETWQHSNHPFGPYEPDCDVFYRADYFDDPHGPDGEKSPEGRYRFWNPSIHMPRTASRITLEITSVRVERLQDISDRDCEAEGVLCETAEPWFFHVPEPGNVYAHAADEPKGAYRKFLESFNGAGAWDANPWVWVIDFKRVAT